MYNPVNGCSAFLHLLLKHPILIVGLGLAVGTNFLSSQIGKPVKSRKIAIKAEVKKLQTEKNTFLTKEANLAFKAMVLAKGGTGCETSANGLGLEKWFEAIKYAESGNKPIGQHPDGISWGPAGLTKNALKDVLKKIGPCQRSFGYKDILKNPNLSVKFAYLYFLDLVWRFKNIEKAVLSYHYGPTRIEKWEREKRKIYHLRYLKKVKKFLKKQNKATE